MIGRSKQQFIVESVTPPVIDQQAQHHELAINAPLAPFPANASIPSPTAEVIIDATPSPFSPLYKDLRGYVADVTRAAALANLVRTNKRTYALFQVNMDKKAASVLLGHVLYGNKAEAEKMLTANPRPGRGWKIYVEQKLQTYKTYAANPATKCKPVCSNAHCEA